MHRVHRVRAAHERERGERCPCNFARAATAWAIGRAPENSQGKRVREAMGSGYTGESEKIQARTLGRLLRAYLSQALQFPFLEMEAPMVR